MLVARLLRRDGVESMSPLRGGAALRDQLAEVFREGLAADHAPLAHLRVGGSMIASRPRADVRAPSA